MVWKNTYHHLGQHPLLQERLILKQFIKFAMVGVLNTITSFSVYLLTTRLIGLPPLLGNALAFVVAVTISFLLNKRWTFRNADRGYVKQYSLFFSINIIGFGLSETIIFVLHHLLGWHDIVAFFSSVLIVMFWNFGANRLWTFKSVH